MRPGLSRLLVAAVLVGVIAAAILGGLLAGRRGSGEVRVVASTTTSLYATGLLDALAQAYENGHPGVSIEFVPVGSGQALRLAADGSACMVFVHAPSLEKTYIEKGSIENGRVIAFNYFVIVGPKSDPAGIRGAGSAVEAFKRIYEAGEEGRAKFVSRGDMSGTHVREMKLWRLAGLDPEGRPWYLVSGTGMGQTLVMASEIGAYTLSDVGTFLAYKREGRIPGLEALYTGDRLLINVYSVYISSSCTGPERRAAEGFLEFVAGPDGQSIIANYGLEKYGAHLFYPALGNETRLREAWEWLAGDPG